MKHHSRALRPAQWIKSLLVLAAPIAAGEPLTTGLVANLLGAIFAFIAASSATYLLNDFMDLSSDRLHPEKKFRPLSSGSISPKSAMMLAVGAIVLAMLLSIFVEGRIYIPLVVYFVLNASYSLGAKKIPVLELVIVASGFILRLIVGSMTSGVPVSVWLFIFVGCGALMVVSGKRLAEKLNCAISVRGVLESYQESSLKTAVVMLGVALVSSYVGWFLWGVETTTETQFVLRLFSLVALVCIVFRYLVVSSRKMAESPESLIVRDQTILIAAVAWLICFVSANLVA